MQLNCDLYAGDLFVFDEIYFYKVYKDHPKMNYDLHNSLKFESNVTIEYWDVEFWDSNHEG